MDKILNWDARCLNECIINELSVDGEFLDEECLLPARNVFRRHKFLTREPFNVAWVVKLRHDEPDGGCGYVFHLLDSGMEKLYEYYDGK